MFLNGYPYTDFHELNLDFILKAVQTLQQSFKDFTASNSLIFAEPLLHDLTKTYSKNTIVLDHNGNAYIALQNVPEGVQLSNSDYWLMVFNFEEYTEKANKNFTVNYFRDVTRTPYSLSVDDWIVLNDVLYKVTVAIPADGLFEIGTNIVHFTIEQFLKDFIVSINQTVLQYKNDIDASELAYRQQLAQDIANTTSSLQAQLDAAISGATVDSEVINARVGADNVTYNTLGDAIRTQITLLYDILNDNISNNIALSFPNNGYITPTGELNADASYYTTDFLEAHGNVIITGDFYGLMTSYRYINCYDADKNFIGGIFPGISGGAMQKKFNYPYKLLAGTAYIRITNHTSHLSNCYLSFIDDVTEDAKLDFDYAGFIDNTGQFQTNSSFLATGYIPTTEYIKVTGKIGGISPSYSLLHCYDINKNYRGHLMPGISGNGYYNYTDEFIRLPKGTRFIRLVNRSTETTNNAIEVVYRLSNIIDRLHSMSDLFIRSFSGINYTLDAFVAPNGVLTSSNAFKSTDLIPIEDIFIVDMMLSGLQSAYKHVNFYDSNGDYISGTVPGMTNPPTRRITELITPPANAAYYRLTTGTAAYNSAEISTVITLRTSYQYSRAVRNNIEYFDFSGFNVFTKFATVGDSLDVGYYTDSDSATHSRDDAHSWSKFIEKATGTTSYRTGTSGATCKSWLESTGTWGLPYCQSLGTMPLYVLDMGANETSMTIGSESDFSSDVIDSLYSYVGRMIRALRTISPDSFIICTGILRETTSPNKDAVNGVYQYAATQTSKCYYLDCADDFESDLFHKYYFNYHYSANGYALIAGMISSKFKEVMQTHVDDFKYINEVDQ